MAAKAPALPALTSDQIKSVKELRSWEKDPVYVEEVVDFLRSHPHELCYKSEPEIVNFWAPPQSDSPKVSEKLIRALEARMTFEELRALPPAVYVGMRREVSKSGTVHLWPTDLYHVACALLVPVRVYGYQKVSQGTGVGGIWVYVDMVCGILWCPRLPALGGPRRPLVG